MSHITRCPTAVVAHIATHLDLGSHARFARVSRRIGDVCTQRAASPVQVTLPHRAATVADADPARMLRHYRPLRLKCSTGVAELGTDDARQLAFLATQSQLRELDLCQTDGARVSNMRWLARLPALGVLRTDVACWRDDVTVHGTPTQTSPSLTASSDSDAETGRQLWFTAAPATALTELRLTDFSVLISDFHGERPAVNDSDPRGQPRIGRETMRWTHALTRLETLEVRCAPALRVMDGLGATHTRLRLLTIGGIERDCDVTALGALPALRALDLSARWAATRLSGLEALAAASALRSLEVRRAWLPTLDALRRLTQLTRLSVLCDTTVDTLRPLAQLRRMRALTVARFMAVPTLVGLERLTRLERLAIDGAHTLVDWTALAALPRLRAFTIGGDLWSLRSAIASSPALLHLTRLDLSAVWIQRRDLTALVDRTLAGRLTAADVPGGGVAAAAATTKTIVIVSNLMRTKCDPARDSSLAHFVGVDAYRAALGAPTHDSHRHALRRVVQSGVPVGSVAATADSGAAAADVDADAKTAVESGDGDCDDRVCERCAASVDDADSDVWECAACDYRLCRPCAAATMR